MDKRSPAELLETIINNMNKEIDEASDKKDLLNICKFPLKTMDRCIKMNIPEKPVMVYDEVKPTLAIVIDLFLTNLLLKAQALTTNDDTTTLTVNDIIATVKDDKRLDFLIDKDSY